MTEESTDLRAALANHAASSTQSVHFSGHVLIVEDYVENQKYFSSLLTTMGFSVTVAEDGETALDAAINNKFCLLIIDTHLPGIDGQIAIRILREHGIETPILALSADSRQENVDRCYKAGCSDFLSKPFSHTSLSEKLTLLLGQRIDDGARSKFDSCEQDFAQTKNEFITSFGDRIVELERVCLLKEYDLLNKVSHKLAGAAAFVYPDIYELLLALNEASRSKNSKVCLQLLIQLKEMHVKHEAVKFISEEL